MYDIINKNDNNYIYKKNYYNNVIKNIPSLFHSKQNFKISGLLNICLIEYRIMDEIKWVLNALLQVYNSDEIGLTIVCGNHNVCYISNLVKKWDNVNIINTGHDNLNRQLYSALLKSPSFWERFENWSHVLIYQTDALIFRKIDACYFDFDYIGAPWGMDNQWVKHCGGNGGFSLRRISAMIKACERYRNYNHSQIIADKTFPCNEDGYLCSLDELKFPPINSDIHKAFSVEQVFHSNPIGCHQIYKYISNKDFYYFIDLIKIRFIKIQNKITQPITSNNNDNVLIFTLFGGMIGVGFFNQIFSLELGIFMSQFFKRKLVILVKKPIAALGVPNWELGTIFDYINDISSLLPYGHEIIINNEHNINKSDIHKIVLPKYISSCCYIDKRFRGEKYHHDVSEFCHHRINISNDMDILLDKNVKYVSFEHSNASRLFYNFYTCRENYLLMNKIALHFTEYNEKIMKIYNSIILPKKYLSFHLRFGDSNKTTQEINRGSDIILENLLNWLKNNNIQKYPIFIMTDHNNHKVIERLREEYEILLPSHIYNIASIQSEFKNSIIPEFLIDKLICENANQFIGTRTSTVSVHINYVNYINYKPYEHYCNYINDNFDTNQLKYKDVNPKKKYSWSKYSYDHGNPVSWTLFFKDNIFR